MQRVAFEAALSRDGYQIVVNTMQPNAVNPAHDHGFDARLLVVAGAITIIRDGAETRTYSTGDTYEIPAGTRHSETAGEAGATYVAGRRQPA